MSQLLDLKDRINIIQACEDEKLINLKLLPTQRIILKAMYGIPMLREERTLFLRTFSEPAPKNTTPFRQTILVLGRGSGKSTLVSAVAVFEACFTNWRRFLRTGQVASIFVFATREKQAIDVGRNMIFNMIESSPVLRDLIVDASPDDLKFLPKTSSDTMVLKTGAAITAMPCKARVGRGYPIPICILDEAAWFARESKNDATDQGVYDSVFPRTIEFREHGKIFIISSPADKSGLVWERYRKRLLPQSKKDYFCVRASTMKMRPDYRKEDFDYHMRMSPLGAERELKAEFISAKEPLIPIEQVEACCRQTTYYQPNPYKPDYSYIMAFDAAFGQRDGFGIAVGHVEIDDATGKKLIVIDLAELLDLDGETSPVDAAAARVAEIYAQYDIFEAFCDQYQADAFGSILETRDVNVTVSKWQAGSHMLKYGRLKNYIKRKMISFPRSDVLIEEISGLEKRYLPASGQYTVTHKEGGHDDLADAVCEVTFQLTVDFDNPTGVIYMGEDRNVHGAAEKTDDEAVLP